MTNADRKTIGLSKTHANDAVAIAVHRQILFGVRSVADTAVTTYYRQVRKKKRSLHEATARKGKSRPNTNAVRNRKNIKEVGEFCLLDKVKVYGKVGWITGFTGNSCCYVKTISDKYIQQKDKSYKQISLSQVKVLCHSNNWITGYNEEGLL